MANPPLPTQREAVAALKEALVKGELSPEEARIALAQFSFLTELSREFQDRLESASTEDELKGAIASILDRAEHDLAAAPGLGESTAAQPMTAEEVAAIARGASRARAEVATARAGVARDMRSLIKRSVTKYAAADIEGALSRLTAAVEESQSAEAAAAELSRQTGEQIRTRELEPIWHNVRREKIAREVLAENPTLPTIETAVRSILQEKRAPLSDETEKHISLMAARAEAVLEVPQSSGKATDTPWDNVTGAGNFFRSLPNQSLIQKAVAPVADIVISVFPQEAREKIVGAILSGSLERGVDRLTKTLGEKAFVDLRFAVGTKMVAAEDQRAAATSALVGVQKFLSGTVGAVFQKPMDEAAVTYLTHIHEKVIGVASWQQMYSYHIYPQHPHVFHLEFLGDVGGWALRLGARKAVAGTARAAAGKVAAEGATKGIGALLAKLGVSAAAGAATGGTSLLAQAAMWLGGSLLGRAWGGIKSFLGGLTGGTTNQTGIDWAIGGVLLVAVLVPILGFSIGDISRTTPLATSVGGGPTGPFVDCARTPTDPICQYEACPDCEWPTSGYITQGPRSCSTASHEGVNAIDIGAGYRTPVYTITGGHVSAKSTYTCADVPNRTCNSGYGNWIDITSPEGDTIRYAHLAAGSIPLGVGAPVDKGDQIGAVDNNGNSTGHHLHVEVRSGPNIFSFLPQDYVARYGSQLEGCSNSECHACPGGGVGG